jgi:hypothetical protein
VLTLANWCYTSLQHHFNTAHASIPINKEAGMDHQLHRNAEEPAMTIGWNDNAPIYRQLKDRVIGMMLDGAEGRRRRCPRSARSPPSTS